MNLPVMPPIEPMLAKSVNTIPPGCFYEPKWDGFRAMVFRDGAEVVITSRNSRPLARYFPEVVAAVVENLPPRCVVDGEIVVANRDTGHLDFWALQQRLHPADSRVRLLADLTPAEFIAFDLLALDNTDLMSTRFLERRRLLDEALKTARPPIHLTPMTDDSTLAAQWFDSLEGAGLDGVVAKDGRDRYEPGRRIMFKIKHERTLDCVVVGYRTHKAGAGLVGSLLLGLYADGAGPADAWAEMFQGLVPIGVAASFPMALRSRLATELAPLVIDIADHPWHSTAAEATPQTGSRWNPDKDLSFVPLKAERVAEVRYNHMDGGQLRHPAQFLRWRPDRDPSSCGFAQLESTVAVNVQDVLKGH
ncbi:ATP-dependent DNA ligase [soil metagenome]